MGASARHFPLARSAVRLRARSRANRSAVRLRAAACDAFLARAARASGVIVSRLRLPPREPISAITSRIRSRAMRLPMHPWYYPYRLGVNARKNT